MNTPITKLFTQGLGFCCLWAGLQANRHVPTGTLAAGLGVTDRAIRYVRAQFRSGEIKCQECGNCYAKRLTTLRRLS